MAECEQCLTHARNAPIFWRLGWSTELLFSQLWKYINMRKVGYISFWMCRSFRFNSASHWSLITKVRDIFHAYIIFFFFFRIYSGTQILCSSRNWLPTSWIVALFPKFREIITFYFFMKLFIVHLNLFCRTRGISDSLIYPLWATERHAYCTLVTWSRFRYAIVDVPSDRKATKRNVT